MVHSMMFTIPTVKVVINRMSSIIFMFYKYSNGELVNKAKGVKPVRVFTLTPELHELIVHYSFFLSLKDGINSSNIPHFNA
jgi:hypothetical protein